MAATKPETMGRLEYLEWALREAHGDLDDYREAGRREVAQQWRTCIDLRTQLDEERPKQKAAPVSPEEAVQRAIAAVRRWSPAHKRQLDEALREMLGPRPLHLIEGGEG